MSSSDVSDLEAEKKKMADDKKKNKNLSDSEDDSDDDKKKKKKQKKKMEAKKKEEKKKKRKADSDSGSDSEDEEKSKKKKKKQEKEEGVDLDEEGRADLGRDKMLDVRQFKGRVLIDIREFYMDRSSGEKKPGKKGVCLGPAEWEKLKEHVNWVDKKIKKLRS